MRQIVRLIFKCVGSRLRHEEKVVCDVVKGYYFTKS